MIATYAAITVFAYGALSDLIGKAILYFSYASEDYSYLKEDEGKTENDAVTPITPNVPEPVSPFSFEEEDPFAVDDFSFDFGGPSIPEPIAPQPEVDPFALDF